MITPEHAKYEAFAKEILRRCMAEEDPEDMHTWMLAVLQRIEKTEDIKDFLFWLETFDYYSKVLAHRLEVASQPEEERKALTWPWSTWNNLIEPLAPGMLAVVSAGDGVGKTIYGECIAEHWAKHHVQVVYVHFELSHAIMLDRRAARHTGLTSRQLRNGMLTPEQMSRLNEANYLMAEWSGGITYVHTPGWTMERTTNALTKLRNEGKCDGVVFDYLEKVAPSKRQLQYFGTNTYQREADNVESLKTFAEQAEIPVLMIAQMTKAGKVTDFKDVDRNAMRGAGEKSEKANLVVLLNRERGDEKVKVLIDKNTMGPCDSFEQHMEPEYFRVADVYQGGNA